MFSYTYPEAGSYQVTLTVTDGNGLTNSDTTSIQVTNELPTASFVVSPGTNDNLVGDLVSFDGSSSSDSDGSIISFDWDFGDGTSANDVTAGHSYTQQGQYTVTLTVTDNAGGMNSSSTQVTVIDQNVLNAPTNLSADTNGSSVTLSWNDTNLAEEGYLVERGQKTRGRVRFSSVATLDPNVTRWEDAGLSDGNYRYRVSAIKGGELATSDTINVTVDSSSNPDPDPSGLPAPTNLQGSLSGSSLTLTWGYSDLSLVDGFYVQRGRKAKGRINYETDIEVTNGTTFVDDMSNLASGNYSYRVRAFKGNEASDFSNTFEIRKK